MAEPVNEIVLREIYDVYRHAALSAKYYAMKLKQARRTSNTLEVLIAVGATAGAGQTALAAAAQQLGIPPDAAYWLIAAAMGSGGIAAVLAGVKPFLKLDQRIEHCASQTSGYRGVVSEFERIAFDIKVKRAIDQTVVSAFDGARGRFVELEKGDDPHVAESVLNAIKEKVNREIPPESLWWPAPTVDPEAAGRT